MYVYIPLYWPGFEAGKPEIYYTHMPDIIRPSNKDLI